MTQHIRESVLDGIVAALSRIARDSTVTWATARPPRIGKLSRATLSLSEYPQILVLIAGESKESRATSGVTRVLDSSMDIVLDCWIQGDQLGEELSALLHDVEKVIAIDPSFGGACRTSQITGNRTTLLDEGQRAGLTVNLQAQYGHIDTDPSVLR